MQGVPTQLRDRLSRFGQDHALAFWNQLSEPQRADLVHQLSGIDLDRLQELFSRRDGAFPLPASDQIQPVPVARLAQSNSNVRAIGEAALCGGEVAFLVVAGGHGTRLGFDSPKGMYPIGPVSGKSLFQIHAEKVLAVSRRFGRPVPFLVMTSQATHNETKSFFQANKYFGLTQESVVFFQQREMPALDSSTGKLLLETPGKLFTSPNGHGGMLSALAEFGLIDQLRSRGIRHIYYFQVDNPLTKIADADFLGRHVEAEAEISCKVVAKRDPTDKLGNFVLVDGRCTMIEYSDLPDQLARERDELGGLRIWAGNPAIHFFSIDFLSRAMADRTSLPFHVARKKVPFIDAQGRTVEPARENALKFEMFIFDLLPRAKRWVLVETPRNEEFVPLKNADGPDSPPLVRQAISNVAADWLERAGVNVPRNGNGDAAVALEISPVFALDAAELASKLNTTLSLDGPLYLE